MKIFNIPFPQSQILYRPPHRRPPVNPLQNRSLPSGPCPVSHFPPHLSRNPLPTVPGVPFPAPPVLKSLPTSPGVPFSAPPVPKSPLNLSRCPGGGTTGAVWMGKRGREIMRLMRREGVY